MLKERLIEAFGHLGFDEYRDITTDQLVFSQDVLNQCAKNTCSSFGKNHGCPPLAGSEDVRKARVLKYPRAFLLTKIVPITSRQEMNASLQLVADLKNQLIRTFRKDEVMVLGAGPCKVCEACTALDGQPCRFPEQTQYSMEGSGIDVVRLAMTQKMTYNAGRGRVGFFTLVLYED